MTWDEIVAAAKQEGEVTFSVWLGPDYFKEAAKQFTDKYGIRANVLLGANAIDKILAEKDRPVGTIDVQAIGGADLKTSIDAGLWYGPIFNIEPNHTALNSPAQALAVTQEGITTNGYFMPYTENQVAMLYDPAHMPTLPQTWDEFAAWVQATPKGFAYNDPNHGGAGQAFVQAVLASLSGGLDKYNGDTEVDQAKVADWSAGWDWLVANNPNMTVTTSNNANMDLLNQGGANMVVAWTDDATAGIQGGTLSNAFKMYIPKFGLAGGGDSIGVVKNSPNPAAALLFIDWLTSPEMQTLMNQTLKTGPVRDDVTAEFVPDVQFPENATGWMPAAYKGYAADQFTSQVLLH